MWNSLKATYDVKDTVTSRELGQRMREITMTKDDNPKKIPACHPTRFIRYGWTDFGRGSNRSFYSDLTLFLHMLQVHEENMKRNGDTVTVQSIGAALHYMYRQSQMQWKTHREGQRNERNKENRKPSENRNSRSEEGTDNEIALSSVNRNVKCYNCGENGHISRACPRRNNRNNDYGSRGGRFHGKCMEVIVTPPFLSYMLDMAAL
jgi:hypothetical protein